jgi:diphosphomevalonate decarboxylase
MNAVTAQANPNIAFIKYWGNHNNALRIPLNGSISMNLNGLSTITSVRFDSSFNTDKLEIDGKSATGPALKRVRDHLDIIRRMANIDMAAEIKSRNNFPMGSGIASSASAFAALSLAGSKAAGLSLSPVELSRLARQGSGSACRSIPAGITEWHAGTRDADSFADQLAPPEYWDLVDCLAVTSEGHKIIGSSEGHRLADSSPLQKVRVADADRRLEQCRTAILTRDFESFADVIEQDSNLMHSVMCTSNPKLVYWTPVTLAVVAAVLDMRQAGYEVSYTIDAGPNVHIITRKMIEERVRSIIKEIPGVLRIVLAPVGNGTVLVDSHPGLS